MSKTCKIGLPVRSLSKLHLILSIITSICFIFFSHFTSKLNAAPQNVSLTSPLFYRTNISFNKVSNTKNSFEKPILEINSGGHTSIIRDAFFTKDGKSLVTISDDKTARVIDIERGITTKVFRGQIGNATEGMIYAAALSPNNNLLALGGWFHNECPGQCGNIRIIDFHTGEIIKLLKGHTNVILDLAFSNSGKFLISGGFDNIARIWNLKTGKTKHILKGHKGKVAAVAFSPDDSMVVTGSHDNTLKLWDVSSGNLISNLRGHIDFVDTVAFTPNGEYILSGSRDNSIRIWNGLTGKYLKILGVQGSDVANISISPDGKKVLTGAAGDTSINNVFEIPTGKRLSFFSKHDNITLATAISPNGKIALTGGGVNHEFYLWDISTGEVIKKLVGKGKGIFGIGISKEGKRLAWRKKRICPGKSCLKFNVPLLKSFILQEPSGDFNLGVGSLIQDDKNYFQAFKKIENWSIDTPNKNIHPTLNIYKKGVFHKRIKKDQFTGSDHRSVTITHNGKLIISGGAHGVLTSYNIENGKKVNDFIGHTSDVWALSVSPDNRWLFSGSADQTIKIWDISSGSLLLSIFHGFDDEWVAWTPEGFYDASPKGDRYVGWRVNRGYDKPADYYTASQFRRFLYRPDIIRDTLALSSSTRAIKKAGLEKISVDELIKRAPVNVKIASIQTDKSGKTDINIKLGKNKITVPERITIYVNGFQILPQEQRNLSGVNPGDTLHFQTFLPRSNNHIKVLVENLWAENGDQRWVKNNKKDKNENNEGTLHVNAIGIGQYPNLPEKQQLYSPPLDAFNMAQLFKIKGKKLFKNVVVNILTDQDGKLIKASDIDTFLLNQIQNIGPNDTTIYFFAGHGITDEKGNYHFLTADSEIKKSNSQLKVSTSGTSFDWVKLHKILDQTLGRRMVIIDTCEAGEVISENSKDLQKLAKDIHDVNSIIYTGTSRQELGLETEKGGVFTRAIIDGIKGKARFKDGKLFFTSLRNYVDKEVPKRNIEVLSAMQSRGILLKSIPNSELDSTQHPFAVIPTGMRNLVIAVK